MVKFILMAPKSLIQDGCAKFVPATKVKSFAKAEIAPISTAITKNSFLESVVQFVHVSLSLHW